MLGSVEKTPDEVLDYDIDFSRWLPDGDLLDSATHAITMLSGGNTLTVDQVDVSNTAVKVWLSAGAAGDVADIEITAVTEGGRTKEECFRMRVRDC